MTPPEPLVSVVMPVRNALPHLDAAVQSILDQSHRNLEFVILDDASTDGSLEVLRGWAARDRRIRLFESAEPLGPAGSSNRVVRQARAELVARMDADDRSHPDRIRRQVRVLHEHPQAVLVGTLCEGMDARTRRVRGRDRWRLAETSAFAPFQHGSVLFRRSAFEQVGGYREVCDYWEDNDLFLRLAEVGRVVVVPDRLYWYRYSDSSTRVQTSEEPMTHALERMYRCLDEYACGRSYEPLIGSGCPGVSPGTTLRALETVARTRVWAGKPPAIARRLIRHAGIPWDRRKVAVLAWVALASAAPRLFRTSLGIRAWLRDYRMRHRFPDGTVHDWLRPGAASRG